MDVLADETTTAFLASGDLLFDTGRSTLRPEGLASVHAIAAQVKGLPGAVSVEGHTDDVGTDTDNQSLSERRAAAVADRLEAAGIPRVRITTRGLGETTPVSTQDTEAGRQANRRVVVGVAAD